MTAALSAVPAMAPVDVADEASFRALVERDILGSAKPNEAAWLRFDGQIVPWRATLVRLKEENQARLSEIRSEGARRQRECFAMGPAGKSRWLRIVQALEDKRAPLTRRFDAIEARLRETAPRVKLLRAAVGPFSEKGEGATPQGGWDSLRQAHARLDQAETRISSLRTQVAGLRKSVLQVLRVLASGNRLDEATARAIRDHAFPAPIAAGGKVTAKSGGDEWMDDAADWLAEGGEGR